MRHDHVEMPQEALVKRYEALEAIEADKHPHKALEAAREMIYILFEMSQRSEGIGLAVRFSDGIPATQS